MVSKARDNIIPQEIMLDESAQQDTSGEHVPKGYYSSSLFLGTMTGIGTGLLSAIAGFAYAAPILLVINGDLGPSPNLYWVATVYTLCTAVGLTLVGRLTDTFGRRYTFITGALVGFVGCILSANARSIDMLIGGMTLIGLASATQVSYFYITAELVPCQYRFACNAMMYVFAIPGGAFAPAIADACIQNTTPGWRSVFYISASFNFCSLICYVLFYYPPSFKAKHGNISVMPLVRTFDYIGTALFTGGLTSLLLGLLWGGSAYPWKSTHVLAPLCVGIAALGAFVAWETLAKPASPLVPPRLLHSMGWVAAVVASGLGASLYYALAVIWPSMVATIYPSGNLIEDGLVASIVGAGWVFGEILSGFVAKPVRHIRLQMLTSVTLSGIFLALLATSTIHSRQRSSAFLAVSVFFAGYFEGLALTVTTLVLPAGCEIGSSCGFGGSIRFALISIASAVFVSVLSNKSSSSISTQIVKVLQLNNIPLDEVPEISAALSQGTALSDIPQMNGQVIWQLQTAYKQGNLDAYKTVSLVTIAFTGLCLLMCWLIPDLDDLMTPHLQIKLTRNHSSMEKTVIDESKRTRDTRRSVAALETLGQ